MKEMLYPFQPAINNDKTLWYRLTGLWILCEAMLGGIIHGLHLPVSGLIVGSCAVICISLIAWYFPKKGEILKATLIVAIFKMLMSPQASFPAYIAVFFQGATAELFFRNRKYFRLSCFLFASIALLESGLQRILVLTIIYGNDLWTAINTFISKLTGNNRNTNYSFWAGTAYTGIHVVAGFVVGWWASVLPGKIEAWKKEDFGPGENIITTEPVATKRKRRLKMRTTLLIIWLFLLGLYLQSWLQPQKALLPSGVLFKILIRSALIVTGWISIVAPLLNYMLRSWLKKKRSHSLSEINYLVGLLPGLKHEIAASWKTSATKKGLNRWKLFSKILLTKTLTVREPYTKVYIVEGNIQSGKTSSLLQWTKGRNDVYGILTPVREGKRYFMDISTGENFPMEAGDEEKDVLSVGRYQFSRSGFEKAITIIRQAMHQPGWVVIDEIGPLELRGEGFSDVLRDVLSERKDKCILVIRDALKEKVTAHFGINAAI